MYTGGDVNDYFAHQDQSFESLAAKSGVTIPMLLKLLGIAPPTTGLSGDHFWCRNYGERLPLRGGSFWGNQGRAGVFALNLNEPRAHSTADIGFRAAFLSSPDARGLWATGQSRETKGTCLPAGLNGRQKTKTSWIPPVTGQRPGESRNT